MDDKATMLLRLQLRRGRRWDARPVLTQMALVGVALLRPAAFLACVLAAWRIAADLRLAADFAFDTGPLSRWQVWLALAFLLILFSGALARVVRFSSRSPRP